MTKIQRTEICKVVKLPFLAEKKDNLHTVVSC